MKGFLILITTLVLCATCILGSITPLDESEGACFGFIGLILFGIIIAAIYVYIKAEISQRK